MFEFIEAQLKKAQEADGMTEADFVKRAIDEVNNIVKSGKDAAKPDKSGNNADIAKQFGTLSVSDKGASSSLAKDSHPAVAGDVPGTSHKSTPEVAAQLRSRAEFDLQKSHSGKTCTVSGTDSLKVSDYNEKYPVIFPLTPEGLATIQLGPDVTAQQKQTYIRVLETLNKDLLQDDGMGHKVFPILSTVKLPGQTKDGAVTYSTADSSNRIWNDGAYLSNKNDGSGYAGYKHDGEDVAVSWNGNKPEENKWNSSGLVVTDKDSYTERTETSFDGKGKVIQKVFGSKPDVPESIRVSEGASTVIDLKPADDGEFRGQKTFDGKVVDPDMAMTADGKLYSRKVDGDGNVVKAFDDATETYNPKGKLIAREVTGADKETTKLTYKGDQLDSMTITNKDKQVSEFHLAKNGEFVGVKKNPDGQVVDQVGFDFVSQRIYSRKQLADGVAKTFDDGSTEKTNLQGHLTERSHKDAKGREIVETYKGKGKTVVVHEADGSVLNLQPGADGEFRGVKTDAAGKVIDKNAGMDQLGRVFVESTDAGTVTRTLEDGESFKKDSNGKLIERSGKDAVGREFTYYYHPGDTQQYRIDLKTAPADKPLEFNRTADGKFLHESKSDTGETLRTIELNPGDGSLRYANVKDGTELTVNTDGSARSQMKLESGNLRRVQTKSGEMVSEEIHKDANGVEQTVEQTYIDPRGYVFENKYKDGNVDSITIHKPEGIVFINHVGDKWSGTSLEWSGRREDVIMYPGSSIMYKDQATGAVREERIDLSRPGHIVPSLEKVDFDPDAGTISKPGSNAARAVESRASGRVDTVSADGNVSGLTITGDISYQKPSGDAAVVHPTQEGASLASDGSIETWSNGVTRRESMTTKEESFLKRNPAVDRRDLVEIHRRYRDDRVKIDAFYSQLERVNSADNLSESEKAALVKTLMHTVAYPAEIYQGGSPTCNVTVLQRDMAVSHPDKYAGFVMDALDGEFNTAAGENVRFDVGNLKAQDFSGRDIASRVFQTAALNVLHYPQQIFENTADGNGRFREVIRFNNRAIPTGNDTNFGGLGVPDIARIRYDLTGESKAQISVHSAKDLVALYKANGGGPMTVAVDADTYPFSDSGPIDDRYGGHVVTITGMEPGTPVRFYVQNQWGLQSDHSSPITTIEAEDLYNNMTRFGHGGVGLVIGKAPRADKNFDATVADDGTVTLK